MSKELIIAIISAIGGGLFALIGACLNNQAKRFELEYNYRSKMQENYHTNAKQHIDDLYLPLYIKLVSFGNECKVIDKNNKQNIKQEIGELARFIDGMKTQGVTAFLTNEVEETLEKFLQFIQNSIDAERPSYFLIEKFRVFGNEYTHRKKFNSFGPGWIAFYRLVVFLTNLVKGLPIIIYNNGLIDFRTEIVLDSANLISKEFKEQLDVFLIKIKRGIKDITLGVK
jgi:hypothetical protein